MCMLLVQPTLAHPDQLRSSFQPGIGTWLFTNHLKPLSENQQDVLLFVYFLLKSGCPGDGWSATWLKAWFKMIMQHANRIVSIAQGIENFAIMPLKKHSVLNLPNRQVKGDLTTDLKYFKTNFKFLINSHGPTESHGFRFI